MGVISDLLRQQARRAAGNPMPAVGRMAEDMDATLAPRGLAGQPVPVISQTAVGGEVGPGTTPPLLVQRVDPLESVASGRRPAVEATMGFSPQDALTEPVGESTAGNLARAAQGRRGARVGSMPERVSRVLSLDDMADQIEQLLLEKGARGLAGYDSGAANALLNLVNNGLLDPKNIAKSDRLREAIDNLALRYDIIPGDSVADTAAQLRDAIATRIGSDIVAARQLPGSSKIIRDERAGALSGGRLNTQAPSAMPPEGYDAGIGATPLDEEFVPVIVTETRRVPLSEVATRTSEVATPTASQRKRGILPERVGPAVDEETPILDLDDGRLVLVTPAPRVRGGQPTYRRETVTRVVPQRRVGNALEDAPGEFTVLSRQRDGSDGNRSAEERVWAMQVSPGRYQVVTATDSGFESDFVDAVGLQRAMESRGLARESGPDLGIEARQLTEDDAASRGRQLFEAYNNPGDYSPQVRDSIVREVEELQDFGDGSLYRQALEAAGFRADPARRREAGQAYLESVRQQIDYADPAFSAQSSGPGVDAARRSAAAELADVERSMQALGWSAFGPQPPSTARLDYLQGQAIRLRKQLGIPAVLDSATRQDVMASPLPPELRGATSQTQAGLDLSGRTGQVAQEPVLDADGNPTGDVRSVRREGQPIVPGTTASAVGAQRGMVGATVIDTSADDVLSRAQFMQSGWPLEPGLESGLDAAAGRFSYTDPAPRVDILGNLRVDSTPESPVFNFDTTAGSWAESASGATPGPSGRQAAPEVPGPRTDYVTADNLEAQADRELQRTRLAAAAEVARFRRQQRDILGLQGDMPPPKGFDVFRDAALVARQNPAFNSLPISEQADLVRMNTQQLMGLRDDLIAELGASAPRDFNTTRTVYGDVRDYGVGAEKGVGSVDTTFGQYSLPLPADSASEQAFGVGKMQQLVSAYDKAEKYSRDLRELLALAQQGPDAVRNSSVFRRMGMRHGQIGLDTRRQVLGLSPEQLEDAVRLNDAFLVIARSLGQDSDNIVEAAALARKPLPQRLTPAEMRAAAAERQAEAQLNAQFLASLPKPGAAALPRAEAQSVVREVLGLKPGDQLPLAFRDYDSRVGTDRQITGARVADMRELERRIASQTNDLRRARADGNEADVERLEAALEADQKSMDDMARQLEIDAEPTAAGTGSPQARDSSGANQARLVELLVTGTEPQRLAAVEELFSAGGDGGLVVLERLAADGRLGNSASVLRWVLGNDEALTNVDGAVRALDEAGTVKPAMALGSESLDQLAAQTAALAAREPGRRVDSGGARAAASSYGGPDFQEVTDDSEWARLLSEEQQLDAGRAQELERTVRSGLPTFADIQSATNEDALRGILSRINEAQSRVARIMRPKAVSSSNISVRTPGRQGSPDVVNELPFVSADALASDATALDMQQPPAAAVQLIDSKADELRRALALRARDLRNPNRPPRFIASPKANQAAPDPEDVARRIEADPKNRTNPARSSDVFRQKIREAGDDPKAIAQVYRDWDMESEANAVLAAENERVEAAQRVAELEAQIAAGEVMPGSYYGDDRPGRQAARQRAEDAAIPRDGFDLEGLINEQLERSPRRSGGTPAPAPKASIEAVTDPVTGGPLAGREEEHYALLRTLPVQDRPKPVTLEPQASSGFGAASQRKARSEEFDASALKTVPNPADEGLELVLDEKQALELQHQLMQRQQASEIASRREAAWQAQYDAAAKAGDSARLERLAASKPPRREAWIDEPPALLASGKRGGVRLQDEQGRPLVLKGELRIADEPAAKGSWVVSWGADGKASLRQEGALEQEISDVRLKISAAERDGNMAKRARLLKTLGRLEAKKSAAGAAAAGGPAARAADAPPDAAVAPDAPEPDAPAQRTEPLEETYAYDSQELDEGDAPGLDGDIEASLQEPVPGPGRRRATEEYEAEQARRAEGGSRSNDAKPGKKSLARRIAQAGGLVLAGSAVRPIGVGIGLEGLSGGRSALGVAPETDPYAAEADPSAAAGDINTSAEPVGSQVRRARRMSYLTTQNPLPY